MDTVFKCMRGDGGEVGGEFGVGDVCGCLSSLVDESYIVGVCGTAAMAAADSGIAGDGELMMKDCHRVA